MIGWMAWIASPSFNGVPVEKIKELLKDKSYDQAELLARGLGARTRIPLRLDLVERTRRTRAQVGLNAAQRQANMRDAFAAKGPCPGLHVLLIDDVYTTGATMAACASALRGAGAAWVCGLTLALPNSAADHNLS